LFAAAILGGKHPEVRKRLAAWRQKRTAEVLAQTIE
jgi:hypothetical protein